MMKNFIRFFRKEYIVTAIAVLSFFAAIVYNEINRNVLIKTHSNLLRCNQTVITADDISYIRPAQNFINGMGWKSNSVGNSKYFQRPPGYGLFYAFFYWLFGLENGLRALKIAQVLLFALSVICFFYLAESLFKRDKISYLLTFLYGITPFTSCFLYYTITESITPSIMLFYIYFLSKASNQVDATLKNKAYFYAAALLAYLILTRPVLAIFGILFPAYLFQDYYQNAGLKILLKKYLVYGCISCSLIGCWEIRNYLIAGKFVGLHPIYFEDENSIFRPIHKSIWNFSSAWGMTGTEFHELIVPIWEAAVTGKDDSLYIQKFIKAIPDYVIKEEKASTVNDAFQSYHNTVADQRLYYEKNMPMPLKLMVSESIAIKKFEDLATHFRQKHLSIYLLSTPFKRFKEIAFHSNLSLYIFQHTYRGNSFIEFLRLLFFAIHSLAFIFFIFNVVVIKKLSEWFTFFFSLVIYIFFLIYFIGGLEERYTTPILPFLMMGSAYALLALTEALKKFRD